MELNGDDSDTMPRESRSKPFDIDLHETPLLSPRETSVAGAAADVSSAPVPARNSGRGNRVGDRGFGLLDINALPPCEEGSSEYISASHFSSRTNLKRLQEKQKGNEWSQDPFMKKASFKRKARYNRKDLCAAFRTIVIPAPLHPRSPILPADDETEGQLQHRYKRQRVEIEHVCLSEAGSASAATIYGSGVLSSGPATTTLPFVPSPVAPASSPPASASKSPAIVSESLASKSPPAASTVPFTDAPSLSLPCPSLPSSFAHRFPELPSISPSAFPSIPTFDSGEFRSLLESVCSLVSSPQAQQGLASLLRDPTLCKGILQFCEVSTICAAKQLQASESRLQNVQDKFTAASEALELLLKELDNESTARKKDLSILAATQSELSAFKERLASMESENRGLHQHNETLRADLCLALGEKDRLRAEVSKTRQDLATSREEQDLYFGLHSSLCTEVSGFDKPRVTQVYQRKGRH